MILQDRSIHVIQQVTDGLDVGECQLKALMCAWVEAELISHSGWNHHSQVRSRVSSTL